MPRTRRAAYMPLAVSSGRPPPPTPRVSPLPPSGALSPAFSSASSSAAASSSSFSTHGTSASPIYQNIEECRFLHDALPEAARRGASFLDIDGNIYANLEEAGAPSTFRSGCSFDGYGRLRATSACSASSPSSTSSKATPSPPHHAPLSSSRVPPAGLDFLRKIPPPQRPPPIDIAKSSPICYEDFSEYGDTAVALGGSSCGTGRSRTLDTRPLSVPPSELRRLGSHKHAGHAAGIPPRKPRRCCRCSLCVCLLFSTFLVFGTAIGIFLYFNDIEQFAGDVVNKL